MLYKTARQKTAAFYFALAHPRRLKIIDVLAQNTKPMTYEALSKAAEIPDASLSHHLRVLGDAGLLRKKIKDHYSHYSLNSRKLEQMTNLPPSLNFQTAA